MGQLIGFLFLQEGQNLCGQREGLCKLSKNSLNLGGDRKNKWGGVSSLRLHRATEAFVGK